MALAGSAQHKDDAGMPQYSNGHISNAAEPAGPRPPNEAGASWPSQHIRGQQQQPAWGPVPNVNAPEQQQLLMALAQQQWMLQQQQQQQYQQQGMPYPVPIPMPAGMQAASPQHMAALMPAATTGQQVAFMPVMWPMPFPPGMAPGGMNGMAPSMQPVPDAATSEDRATFEIKDITDVDERPVIQQAAAWYLSKLSFLVSLYMGMCLYALGLAMLMLDMGNRLVTRHARLAAHAASAVANASFDGSSGSSSSNEALAPLLEMPEELRHGERDRAAQGIAQALAARSADGSADANGCRDLVWLSPQQWAKQGLQAQQNGQQQQQQEKEGEQQEEQDVLPWPCHALTDSLAVVTGLWFGVWLRVVRTFGWQLPLTAARSLTLAGLAQLRVAFFVCMLAARATFALVATTYVAVPTREFAPLLGFAARTADFGRRAASAAFDLLSDAADGLSPGGSSTVAGSSSGGIRSRLASEPRAMASVAVSALRQPLAALIQLLESAVAGLVRLRRAVLDSNVQVVPLAALIATVARRGAAFAAAAVGRGVALAEAGAAWAVGALTAGAPVMARQMLVAYLSFLFTMLRRLGEESANMVGQLAALLWQHHGSGLVRS